MFTLVLVLSFPAVLSVGFGVAWALRRDAVAGARAFVLYSCLLTIPFAAVLIDSPRAIVAQMTPTPWTPAWAAGGAVVGALLWGAALLWARGRRGAGRVWAGAPGWRGYAGLMLPVAYVVVAEEVVWRGYLLPEVGWLLSSAAFALHHYPFGWRHVAFAFAAGAAWAGLSVAEGRLFSAIVSHLTYDALAWATLRRAKGE